MNTYEFNLREEHLLIYAIANALASTERVINFYTVHNDIENAEKEREDLSELKTLYKRFLPNLKDEDLFK